MDNIIELTYFEYGGTDMHGQEISNTRTVILNLDFHEEAYKSIKAIESGLSFNRWVNIGKVNKLKKELKLKLKLKKFINE